jgi:polar amino acid transport system substrate-binding protein
VRRIANAIFGDPNKVQFVVYDVADRVKAVQSKEVDIVVNTLSITCARQQQIAFSSPYLTAQQRIMVPIGSGIREVEDLAGQRICTSAGSTTERVLKELPVAQQAADPMEVVTESNIADCVIRLQQGQVSAVSTDDIILAGLSAQDPQTEVVGRVLDTTDLGIGINNEYPDLVQFVNAVLEQGRQDGSLEASYAEWLGRRLNPPPLAPAARYRD